jgi:Flp pilus assembly protein TadG
MSQERKMDRARSRGAVVVEFALIFLLLVLMLLGTVEFGRAWYVVHVLSSAAREGARVGALMGGDEDREAAIRARIGEILGPAGLTDVTVTIDLSNGYGRPLKVSIERDFSTVATGLLPQLEHLRLRGAAVFNQESP